MATSTTLTVNHLNCASCAIAMEGICEDLPGVTKAVVNAKHKTIAVEHDETVTPETLAQALTDAGYPATKE